MRRLFSIITILFVINIVVFAQDEVTLSTEVTDVITDEDIPNISKERKVTEFMGIPIDGTKREMTKQLKKKGFKTIYKALEGTFNGQKVYVFIHTNKDKKVWRIVLVTAVATNEGNIKILYNNLCRQFNSNSKYFRFPHSNIENCIIPNDESIYYNMSMQGKQYEAIFYQCLDTHLMYLYNRRLLKMETEEEAEEFKSNAGLLLEYLAYNQVWFTIHKEEYKPEYRIFLYYENGKNQDHGDDL